MKTRPFPEGTTLETELKASMERLQAMGVSYPQDYYEKLLGKYASGVSFPRALMSIGNSRIRSRPHYLEILERRGSFLDYGCGTGDDLRTLIKDDYPRLLLVGFDVDWDTINIGFDLFLDEAEMRRFFVVDKELPFGRETFDNVYSGSVLHTMKENDKKEQYLHNAHLVLRSNGILFGSTLGADDPSALQRPPCLLRPDEMERLLANAGFRETEVTKSDVLPDYQPRYRILFYALK